MKTQSALRFNVAFVLSAVSLLVVACQKESTTEELWKRLPVIQRKSTEGKPIPTELVMDCRRSHTIDKQSLHYYYSVVADPAKSKEETKDDTIVTIIGNSQLNIEIFSTAKISEELKPEEHGSMVSLPVDFSIVRSANDEQVYLVRANKDTAERIENFYADRGQFKTIRAGEIILRFTKSEGKFRSLSQFSLPGLKVGDLVECK